MTSHTILLLVSLTANVGLVAWCLTQNLELREMYRFNQYLFKELKAYDENWKASWLPRFRR